VLRSLLESETLAGNEFPVSHLAAG
jgi:hypothetical protein